MDPSNDDPPWAIPIREPGPDIPQRAATWIDRVPMVPVVGAALAVFVGLVLALPALTGDTPGPSPEVLGAGATSETSVRPEPDSSVDVSSESFTTKPTEPPTSTTAGPTTSAPVEDEAPAPTAGAAVDPEPSDLPIHTPGDLGSGWIAQVSSVPSSAGGEALSRSYETVRGDVPDVLIVRGSEWASLRDGFWVIFRPGFDDGAAAVAACESWGFDGKDECFARYLSADDSTPRTCWRDESGSLAGACT